MRTNFLVIFLILTSFQLFAQIVFKDESPKNKWDRQLCRSLEYNYEIDLTSFQEALKRKANPNVLCSKHKVFYYTPLQQAMYLPSWKYAQDLINAGADVNRSSYNYYLEKYTPIYRAIYEEKWAYVKSLISLEAIVHDSHVKDLTRKCNTSEPIKILSDLIKDKPEIIQTTYENGASLLANVCSVEMIKFLTSKGLDLYAKDNDGNSIMVYTVAGKIPSMLSKSEPSQIIPIIEYLISNGFSVNEISSKGQSLLQIAAYFLNFNTVRFLIERHQLDPNFLDTENKTAFQTLVERFPTSYSEKHIYYQIIEYLAPKTHDLSFTSEDGNTLLLHLMKHASSDLIMFLLDLNKELDINAINLEKESAIYLSTKNNDLQLVKTLVAKGADVSFVDTSGNNLLMTAAANGNFLMLSFFKEQEIGLNRQNSMGQTALMLALKAQSKTSVFYLLRENASVSITDFSGRTALAYAIETGDQELIDLIRMYQISRMGK